MPHFRADYACRNILEPALATTTFLIRSGPIRALVAGNSKIAKVTSLPPTPV